MLLTTTSTLQDRRIDEYKVSGEAILGANAFRDMFAASATSSAAVPPPTSGSCSGPRIWR
jgi:uncharacterized protein YbjQ (UPF0145 family)